MLDVVQVDDACETLLVLVEPLQPFCDITKDLVLWPGRVVEAWCIDQIDVETAVVKGVAFKLSCACLVSALEIRCDL